MITMQQMSSSVCSAMQTSTASLNPNKNYTLKDARDNNTYKIAKLPDGNCWMVQNLMLGNTIINSGSITINSDNSDYSGDPFSISSANVMASGKTNNWTNNDYDVLHIYARSASEKDGNGNPYGNLYNWYTATAKSGTYSMTSGDAPSSLCPKNWRLPSNTGNPSYTNLFQTPTSDGGLGLTATSGTNTTIFGGTSTTVAKAPYSFPMAGYWQDGFLGNFNNYNYQLSRTAYDTNYVYAFYFDANNRFGFQIFDVSKVSGRSLRCVLTE